MTRHDVHFLSRRAANATDVASSRTLSISVIGLGYVGAVSCACLSDLGFRVVGADIDESKVQSISAGKSPIFEKDVTALLTEGVEKGRVTSTTDVVTSVAETDVSFVSVGSPAHADGSCDLSDVIAAAKSIGQGLARHPGYHVVVMRCSVPPETTENVILPLLERESGRRAGTDFGLCFNPEFLREGVAVADFKNPPKTVIGSNDPRAAKVVAEIFEGLEPQPIICTIKEAEIIKYIDNVWHATKVCFANEVGRLSKSYGVDSHAVMDMFVQDTKLNLSPYYLKPGFAYGGACLPKEVQAVNHLALDRGVDVPLMASLASSNQTQVEEAISMVRNSGAERVAVLGVAFKQGTDDLRESPILDVMAALLEDGLKLVAHDFAISETTDIPGQIASTVRGAEMHGALATALPSLMGQDLNEVLDGVEAVVVAHRDTRYAEALIARQDLTVIDLVRLYPEAPTHARYHGIGW